MPFGVARPEFRDEEIRIPFGGLWIARVISNHVSHHGITGRIFVHLAFDSIGTNIVTLSSIVGTQRACRR